MLTPLFSLCCSGWYPSIAAAVLESVYGLGLYDLTYIELLLQMGQLIRTFKG